MIGVTSQNHELHQLPRAEKAHIEAIMPCQLKVADVSDPRSFFSERHKISHPSRTQMSLDQSGNISMSIDRSGPGI